MAYFADTHAASGTPGADMAAIIKTALTSVSGWSFIETYTNGGHVCDVYKSAAAQNGIRDFYLVVYLYAANETYLMFKLGESYDSGTHKLSRYVPKTGADVAPSAAADYTIDDADGELPDSTLPLSRYCWMSAAGWSYWMSITAKRLVLASRYSSTDTGIYAGFCDNILNETAHPSSAVALLLWSGPSGSSKATNTTPENSGGGFTREPGQTSKLASNFSAFVHSSGYTAWPYIYNSASDDTTVYNPDKRMAMRCGLSSARDGAMYYPRALFPEDCLYLPGAAAAVHGDTVTLGGKTYVQMASQLFVDNSV